MADYRDITQTHDEVIVDLSQLMQPLMAYDDISDLLSDEQEQKLVSFVKQLCEMSHSRISRRYDAWLEADRAHDVYVPPEATKFREKAVIADTRAIADTVLTYQMAAITGRNPMFQLEGLDRKSRKAAAIFERLLHQHMRRTAGEARLAQLFLDSIRYGYAPTKIVWDGKTNSNLIVNSDPRRTFPDPRVSWGDWNRMAFIAFTDYASTSSLVGSGLYPKLSKYPLLRRSSPSGNYGWTNHEFIKESVNGLNIDPAQPSERTESRHFLTSPARVIDEAWVCLNGYEIGVPSIGQIWLVFTILDEKYVIRAQLNPYGRQFPTVIGGLYFDRHKTFSQSLYDVLMPLHNIATWLLRSRIDNVQAALSNLIFVDPTQVSVPDLMDRNPWGVVRTLPGQKPGDGVFIAQVPDVTQGHWGDIANLSEMKQRLSAASDAQQGMPTSDGIRTATEIQRLSQLGSQRLGVLARVLSATTIRPMAHMQIQNLQDAVAFNSSIRIDPRDQAGPISDMVRDGYLDFNVADLQGNINYMVVDGTLPIEPTRNAETWLNMLQILNQTGLSMEYNAGRIVEEAIRSMGVPDIDQFRISPEQQRKGMTPSQQMMLMEKMRGASVQPADQVQRQVERGNLIPMRSAA
jgi:hypothetical protein